MPLDYVQQIFTYLYSVCAGIVFAFLYDTVRISRRSMKTPGFIISIQDIIYWLIVSAVSLLFIYHINDGEIRGYIILGMITGAGLYFIIFSKAILFITVPVVKIIINFLGKILKIIFAPIALVKKIIIKIKMKKNTHPDMAKNV